MNCPYCNAEMKLTDGSEVYGRSFGNMYVCSNFPDCDTYIGCYKGTEIPLGIPANAETRKARMQLHGVFDRIWKTRKMTRNGAYQVLATLLDIDEDDCHIANFDKFTCDKAVKLLQDKWFCK